MYSSGVAFGPLVFYANCRHKASQVVKPAIVLPIINSLTSIYAAIVLFSFLGHVSTKFNVPIKHLSNVLTLLLLILLLLLLTLLLLLLLLLLILLILLLLLLGWNRLSLYSLPWYARYVEWCFYVVSDVLRDASAAWHRQYLFRPGL